MRDDKAKQKTQTEIIALPPLKMALVHAKDEHVSKAALEAAIKKIAFQPVTEIKVDRQTVSRLIAHLEKKR